MPSSQRVCAWEGLGGGPLYMKPPLKKRTTCRVQQKFNSPKISPLPNESLPTPTPPFPQKIPPHAPPPSQTLADSGFFGPNTGQFGSEPGYFGSEPGYFGSLSGRFLAFLGQNQAVLGPVSPSLEPLLPGRCAKTSPPTLRMRTHPLHLAFSKSHKIALYYHK